MTKKITLSKQQLTLLHPCGLEGRLKLFGDHEKMDVSQAFEAGFTVSDILWVAGRLNKKKEIVAFAKGCSIRAAERAAYWAAEAAEAAEAARVARVAAEAARVARAARAAARVARAARAARAAAGAAEAAEIEAQKRHLIELFG